MSEQKDSGQCTCDESDRTTVLFCPVHGQIGENLERPFHRLPPLTPTMTERPDRAGDGQERVTLFRHRAQPNWERCTDRAFCERQGFEVRDFVPGPVADELVEQFKQVERLAWEQWPSDPDVRTQYRRRLRNEIRKLRDVLVPFNLEGGSGVE